MWHALCTVYYPDQQMHNIYLLIIFYISLKIETFRSTYNI